jgi:hypothetical protein
MDFGGTYERLSQINRLGKLFQVKQELQNWIPLRLFWNALFGFHLLYSLLT